MLQSLYVIVRSDGATSLPLEANEQVNDPNRMHVLPELLRAGWRPVRETLMGGAGQADLAYCLVLLQKDPS
jgi:hypothetical protein